MWDFLWILMMSSDLPPKMEHRKYLQPPCSSNMSPAPLWFAQPYKDRRLKHGISTWGFPKIGVPQIHVSNTMFFSWEWKRENCKRKGSWAHQQTDKITPRTKMLENQIPSCERIGVSMSYKVALQEGWKISLEDGLIISNFGWFGVPVF